jgi:hypothetical protein
MKRTAILILSFIFKVSISVRAATNADTYIYVQGVKHTLSVSIPADYNPLKSYPLIVGLHYCGGNSNEYRNALKPLCDSLDVIVVCPDNNSSEIGTSDFITASIDTAKSIYNINENEVFLTGMSCNAYELLRMATNGIYPFKGIFPWAPWFSSFNSTTFNLDCKIPLIISVGTADPNYLAIIKLYDSLEAHKANVDLVLIQGVGHTLAFAQFSNEMIRCMNYLNDTNSITIDPIDNFEMVNNDPAKEIKVKIVHKTGKDMNIRALSSLTNVFSNPIIVTTPGNDTVIVRITPLAGKSGTVHVIVEAAEDGGSAIEQTVFIVKVNKAPTAINQSSINEDFEVYPNPAGDYVFVKSSEKNISVQIIDLNGRIVLTKNNYETSSSLDVSKLSKGIYFLKASNANLVKTARIVLN